MRLKIFPRSPKPTLSGSPFIHILGWLFFIAWEQATVYYISGRLPDVATLYFYGCNIALFYTHLWILRSSMETVPRSYQRLILLITAEILIVHALKLLGDYVHDHGPVPPADRWWLLKRYLALDLIRSISFLGLATLYWLGTRLGSAERKIIQAEVRALQAAQETARLEMQFKEAENAFLQQQLNPHLLFNTLNFIYSSVSRVSEDAAQSVLLLSELLRYSIDGADPSDGKVELAAEVRMIRHLIRLGELRFRRPLFLGFQVDGELSPYRILPLTLLTLAENIFKHGLVTCKDRPATLFLQITPDGQLTCTAQNTKKPLPPFPRKPGTGLNALHKRLAYAYSGERHRLQIQEDDHKFTICLTLTL